MEMKGWAEITYNWNKSNARMNLYGCDTGNDDEATHPNGSFAKRLSAQENMKGVTVSGQPSTAVPSKKPDSREGATISGHYTGETYMVAGDKGKALSSYFGFNKNVKPMNQYKDGEKTGSEYQKESADKEPN